MFLEELRDTGKKAEKCLSKILLETREILSEPKKSRG